MIGFYLDSTLTIPAPKYLTVPTRGAMRAFSVYLGDPDGTTWSTPGASDWLVYAKDAVITAAGYTSRLFRFKNPADASFQLPGYALTLPVKSTTGTTGIEVQVQVSIPPGAAGEKDTVSILCSSVGSSSQSGVLPVCQILLRQEDDLLPIDLSLLDTSRRVSGSLAGFQWDRFRWRDQAATNQYSPVPSVWGVPPSLGPENFIAGAADKDSLQPIEPVDSDGAVLLRLNSGQYFTGINRYTLQSDGGVNDIVPAGLTAYILSQVPSSQTPVFFGDFLRSAYGDYEQDLSYRYVGAGFDGSDSPQCVVNRKQRRVTINQAAPNSETSLIGFTSGQSVDYFYMPRFPVWSVNDVWADSTQTHAQTWSYDPATGLLTLPAIAGVSAGEAIWASVTRAHLISYDTQPMDSTVTASVDLNPATSGTSRGFVYLMHNRRQPTSISVSVDKPVIDIPASKQSIVGLTAYGPVLLENDYALITIQAYGHPGELLPGITLQAIVENDWQGQLNYADPSSTTVVLKTGADGTANAVYTPGSDFGYYLAIGAASGSNLTLPQVLPLAELHNATDGWLTGLYTIGNDNPLYGMVGADTSVGQIPWLTAGSGATYKTNGYKSLWTSAGSPVYPTDALDASGVSYTAGGFSGYVQTLVFPSSIPAPSNLGAYFITFVRWVTLAFQAVGTNTVSNSIIVQLQIPPNVSDISPLILSNSSGVLNQNRLATVNPSWYIQQNSSTPIIPAGTQPLFPVDSSLSGFVQQLDGGTKQNPASPNVVLPSLL